MTGIRRTASLLSTPNRRFNVVACRHNTVWYRYGIVEFNVPALDTVGTCESEISVRIESRIESGVVVYMYNSDCHVGVVYLIMCKPTAVLHATLYVLFFFVSTVGLRVYNLLRR